MQLALIPLRGETTSIQSRHIYYGWKHGIEFRRCQNMILMSQIYLIFFDKF